MLPDPSLDELFVGLAAVTDDISEFVGEYLHRHGSHAACEALLSEVRKHRHRMSRLDAMLCKEYERRQRTQATATLDTLREENDSLRARLAELEPGAA